MKVFLGGTVNGSKWRDSIMPRLKVDYFNPVVPQWNDEAYQRELHEREHCDFCLYVLTPRMEGYYAIAEVVDDSFKKPDKTIFCFLEQDEDKQFSSEQLKAMQLLGKKITENGAVWKHSLEEIVLFLNSAAKSKEDTGIYDEFNDIFISYGRRHSLAFAHKLYNNLKSRGYKVWFDMNDIPLGVDFQEQIDNGIRKAHNFLYVISPHSIKSVYCYKELILALKYNKRIIPILHVEPSDCWDKMHPILQKLNWLYFRQKEDFSIPLDQWAYIDDFSKSFEGLLSLVERHKEYVEQQTFLLDKALLWQQNQRSTRFVLVGKERIEAGEWLVKANNAKAFRDNEGKFVPPPCLPTDLHAEFICESRKNSENKMTDVFLLYDREDLEVKEQIRLSLNRHGITTWSDTTDIASGMDYEKEINKGVETADNVIFILSEKSIVSTYCCKELNEAKNSNKRVFPLLIDTIDDLAIKLEKSRLKWLVTVQYINFTDRSRKQDIEVKNHNDVIADVEARKEKSPYEIALGKLLIEIENDARYYKQHKTFLVQALKWQRRNHADSMLLRGHNLENALSWIKITGEKPYPPTELQKTFIQTSYSKASTLGSEVFISYSRVDSDFARRLNVELQVAEKTTWFDQESIASSSDFQKEIYRGIETSNNFVFVISPDSISSVYCDDEVEFAKKCGKRFITILYRETNIDSIPKNLSAVQWIDFVHYDFSESFSELLRTLDTDRDHVELHTKWSQRASEWDLKGQPEDLLLHGMELKAADEWFNFAIEHAKKPEPTSLQKDFIQRSTLLHKAILAKERQRKIVMRLMIGVAAAFIFVAILGIYAYYLSQVAQEQTKIASKNAREAEKNAEKAKEFAQLATLQKENAENNANEAKKSELRAKKSETLAKLSEKNALEQKKVALKAKNEAEQQKVRAEDARHNAEKARGEAEKSRKEVVKANELAKYHLYVFNALNFANKSIQTAPENEDAIRLKILLAQEAFLLQKTASKYASNQEYQPEILDALHQAWICFSSDSLYFSEAWNIVTKGDLLAINDEKGRTSFLKLKPATNNALPQLTQGEVFAYENTERNTSIFNAKYNITVRGSKDGYIFINKKRLKIHHQGLISDIKFSPDNHWLASSSFDGTLLMWNIKNFSMSKIDSLKAIKINNGKKKILSVAFDKNSDYIIFGDNENLHIRPIDEQLLYNRLKEYSRSKKYEFTRDEWLFYKRGEIEQPQK